jgi:hypothetical protein
MSDFNNKRRDDHTSNKISRGIVGKRLNLFRRRVGLTFGADEICSPFPSFRAFDLDVEAVFRRLD